MTRNHHSTRRPRARGTIALTIATLLSLPSPAFAIRRDVPRQPQAPGATALGTVPDVVLHPPGSPMQLSAPGNAMLGSPNPRAVPLARWLRGQVQASRAAQTPPTPGPRSAVLTDDQREAFETLRQKARGEVRMSVRRRNQTPRQIRGRVLQEPMPAAPGRTRAEATARAFLRNNRRLLLIDDPDRELELRGEVHDELDRTHLRFRQRHRGLEVWPAELVVHLDPSGAVDSMGGAFTRTPRHLNTKPSVLVADAIELARERVPEGDGATVTPPRLIVYTPVEGAPRLAWKMKVDVSLMSKWVVVVDAHDASVLAAFNDVHTQAVQGSGLDLQGNPQSFGTWFEGGTHFMVDTTKQMFDPTSNPPSPTTTRGGIIIQDAQNQPPTSDVQTLPPLADVTSVNPAGPWLADAVSATANFSAVYDYFLGVHGRDSLDDQGGNILAGVRIGQNFVNAFFINENNFMGFGDGEPFAGALDVVAHELTHGVTFHTANLVYQNQSGALNEAFSDIFGEAVEFAATGSLDWRVGTNLSNPFRNMEDPSSLQIGGGLGPYPERFSEFVNTTLDNGGVHINSSIINHAFYQLVEGLPGAIGLADAERIFYRALTVHLTANSQFIDGRLACIQAAEELFGVGSDQALRTGEAFDFVEIFDGAGTPDPPDIPATQGEDSALFLFADPDPFGPQSLCIFTGTGLCLGRLENPVDQSPGIVLSQFDVGPGRAAVTCDGSFAIFVDPFANLCSIPTDASEGESCFDLEGTVFSVAMSPDGNRFGFVLLDEFGEPDNFITVVDLLAEPPDDVISYELVALAPDGGTIGSVLFADAMDFTNDGRLLIYDALTALPLVGGGQVDVWSIYAIDLVTGATLNLVPPVQGLDVGFPALSQTSDRFLAFEALDQVTNISQVLLGDLETGDVSLVGETTGFAIPSYTGDDSNVIYSQDDARTGQQTLTGVSIVEQGIAPDRLTPVGGLSLRIPDADYGVAYRRGVCPEPGAGLLAVFALTTLAAIRRRGRRREERSDRVM